jgi:phosphatidylinositol alpha-1,6-mannosyltransferase
MTTKSGERQPRRIVALFPELLGVGGIQESGRLTAVALDGVASRYGWSVEFLALNDPPGSHVLPSTERKIPFQGFGRSKMRFAVAALRKARGGTRIVLAAHPHLAVPAAQMKLLAPGVKMITISHGVEAWSPLPWFRRLAFLRSDVFLAPSRYTVSKIAEAQGAPKNRIQLLPWPLNPDILRMAGQSKKLPLPASFPMGVIVLTVARLAASERYKGVDRLIESVAQLRTQVPGLHLMVIGGGDDLARHVKLAADLGVATQVRFFDNLSREEIAASYSKADVFAMPSTGEGFGLVFLEAMAFAKPLIGAAAGGIPDVVEDGQNGFLVSPGDTEQLANALQRLVTNEGLRIELGKRGAEIVRTKYRFEGFRAELEAILRSCGLE